MGKAKCKCPPEGAPEWVMTYGDMMSLLLTFFILLASLSEIKKDDVWQAIMQEIQRTFGMHGGGAQIPTNDPPELSLIKILERQHNDQMERPQKSYADDPSVDGKHLKVRKVTPGKQFAIGGPIMFEPGSADLTEQAKVQIAQIAQQLRGHNNKVEVKGHAATGELISGDSNYTDLRDLSYARAKAVMDYLSSEKISVRQERLMTVAVADHEPMVRREYSEIRQRPNRRVEIVVNENSVADFRHAGKSLRRGKEG